LAAVSSAAGDFFDGPRRLDSSGSGSDQGFVDVLDRIDEMRRAEKDG
jgi:hypothetical protein